MHHFQLKCERKSNWTCLVFNYMYILANCVCQRIQTEAVSLSIQDAAQSAAALQHAAEQVRQHHSAVAAAERGVEAAASTALSLELRCAELAAQLDAQTTARKVRFSLNATQSPSRTKQYRSLYTVAHYQSYKQKLRGQTQIQHSCLVSPRLKRTSRNVKKKFRKL